MDGPATASPAKGKARRGSGGKAGGGGGGAAPRAKPSKPVGSAADQGARGGVAKKKRTSKGKPAAAAAADVVGADDEGGAEEAEVATTFRGMFSKDLRVLMYGFGDSEVPIQDTVDLVEDILVDYVRETCCAALGEAVRLGKLEREKASGALKPKIDERDIMFLVRKDPKKYTRIRELLEMQVVIREARKAVDIENIENIESVETLAEGGGGEDAGGSEDLEDVGGMDVEQM